MSQLNFNQIQSGDTLSVLVDKLNYNFDQVIINGGGPQGLRGYIGPPGLPGLQGRIGETGPTGSNGSRLYVGSNDPSIEIFEPTPTLNDVYFYIQQTELKIFQYSATGASGAPYWKPDGIISAPASEWSYITDYSGSTAVNSNYIVNGIGITGGTATSGSGKMLFISPDAYLGVTPDSAVASDTIIMSGDKLVGGLSDPIPNSDSLVTLAAYRHQLRILSTGLSGSIGSAANITANRGGIEHSLENDTNHQVYKIYNADSDGEKYFALGLNTSNGVGNFLICGDRSNRVSLGGTDIFTNLVANVNVVNSLAVGATGFNTSTSFSGGKGILSQGNVSIGSTSNAYANLSVNKSFILGTDLFISSASLTGSAGAILQGNVAIGSTSNAYANLSVNKSLAIGPDSFISSTVFNSNEGVLIHGNIAIGSTSNAYANLSVNKSFILGADSFISGSSLAGSAGAIIQGSVAIGSTSNAYANLSVNKSFVLGTDSFIRNSIFTGASGAIIQGSVAIGSTSNAYANLSVNKSLAIGPDSFISSTVFSNNEGLLIHGGVAIGYTANSYSDLAVQQRLVVGSSYFIESAVFYNGIGSILEGNVAIGSETNSYELLQLGNKLTYSDTTDSGLTGFHKAIGFNTYYDGTHARLIEGNSSSNEGYVKLNFIEGNKSVSDISSLTRFTAVGTFLGLEVGTHGDITTLYSTPASSQNYRGLILTPPLIGGSGFTSDNYVPQLLIGLQVNNYTLENYGKRGTISIAAQNRQRSSVTEDLYNIGLYDTVGNPVAGIFGATGSVTGGETLQIVGINFFGTDGNAATDPSVFSAKIDNNNLITSQFVFGNGSRVGINEIPEDFTYSGGVIQKFVGASGSSGIKGYDIGSLVVGATTSYFSDTPDYNVGIINRGSIIVDQSNFDTGATNNNGLFFKDTVISGDSANSYIGDWGIQYWKDSSYKVMYTDFYTSGSPSNYQINLTVTVTSDKLIALSSILMSSLGLGDTIAIVDTNLLGGSLQNWTVKSVTRYNGNLQIRMNLFTGSLYTGTIVQNVVFNTALFYTGYDYYPFLLPSASSGLTFWKPGGTNGFLQDPQRGYLYLDDGGSVGVGTSNFEYSTAIHGIYEREVLDHGVWQPTYSGTPGDINDGTIQYFIQTNYALPTADYTVELNLGSPLGASGDGNSHGNSSWGVGSIPYFNCTNTGFYIELYGQHSATENVIIYWKAIKNIDSNSAILNPLVSGHPPYVMGNVSSGSAKFAVDGSVLCESIITTSDERLKDNIHSLVSEIDKIKLLNPSSFNIKDTPNVKSLGFIAQDVIKVYPEMIRIFKDSELEGGKMTLDYLSFIPILTKGIQEQQVMIEEKDLEIKNLSDRLSKIEKLLNL